MSSQYISVVRDVHVDPEDESCGADHIECGGSFDDAVTEATKKSRIRIGVGWFLEVASYRCALTFA